MSFLLKSRKGVSGLEYLAIITLVMSGILLGGPYVMRGINAPFKAMEDGALDSAREDIRQGTSGVALPPCVCGDLREDGCGDGGSCAKTSALYRRRCNPLGCEIDLIAAGLLVPPVMQQCRPDPTNTCCLPASSTGNCGDLASNVPGGCPDGEMEKAQVCGSPVPVTNYFCAPDPTCSGGCQPFGSNVAGWCDAANREVGVIGSMPPRTVDSGRCNDDTDMRCKAECVPAAYSLGSTCELRCGNGICDTGETCDTCSDCCIPQNFVACCNRSASKDNGIIFTYADGSTEPFWIYENGRTVTNVVLRGQPVSGVGVAEDCPAGSVGLRIFTSAGSNRIIVQTDDCGGDGDFNDLVCELTWGGAASTCEMGTGGMGYLGCGDGICNGSEDVYSCADCYSCGDFVCSPGETEASCPTDCRPLDLP